jgi:hypothetical protein
LVAPPIGGALIVTPLGVVFEPLALVLAAVATLAAITFPIVGVINLTERDPALAAYPEGWTARRVVRWAMLSALVLGLGGIAIHAGPPGGTAVLGAGICATVAASAFFRHLGTLMGRVPHDDSARSTKFVSWGIAGATAGLLLGLGVDALLVGGPAAVGRAIAIASGACELIICIVGFIGLIGIRAALAKEARIVAEHATERDGRVAERE